MSSIAQRQSLAAELFATERAAKSFERTSAEERYDRNWTLYPQALDDEGLEKQDAAALSDQVLQEELTAQAEALVVLYTETSLQG